MYMSGVVFACFLVVVIGLTVVLTGVASYTHVVDQLRVSPAYLLVSCCVHRCHITGGEVATPIGPVDGSDVHPKASAGCAAGPSFNIPYPQQRHVSPLHVS